MSNFPFRWAERLLRKALTEVPYVALLIRTNFVVEGDKRSRWLDAHEPSRVWHSAQRLPMMHRYQWAGKRSTSNTPYSWGVWERGAKREFPERFYWKDLLGAAKRVRRKAA